MGGCCGAHMGGCCGAHMDGCCGAGQHVQGLLRGPFSVLLYGVVGEMRIHLPTESVRFVGEMRIHLPTERVRKL